MCEWRQRISTKTGEESRPFCCTQTLCVERCFFRVTGLQFVLPESVCSVKRYVLVNFEIKCEADFPSKSYLSVWRRLAPCTLVQPDRHQIRTSDDTAKVPFRYACRLTQSTTPLAPWFAETRTRAHIIHLRLPPADNDAVVSCPSTCLRSGREAVKR
ncbi:uncharacterized protein BCR38DRAFT_151157 [Pseudomassariella vexata]|uniref:Uncharacterized protein n=1 Tax=Pseudomassariella vexata TaxID=1141098 RepID=A0A1Y2E6A6_9PEZI|nr:uncharacterized protein BCR38DRAFT_151157 [Pseudomassariella vexata]ORY67081.1 hypothetical protein BCR38DRAFT_151157 [Pseudomassariella vexata]